MKRLFLIFLSLVLLLACVPTPEEEFVVNKGDNVTEHQIRNEQSEETQCFPDRWDEDETLDCGKITVSIHADVVQRPDGVYPVYRTRREVFSQERTAALLSALLGTPKSRTRLGSTKDDWKREFQAFVDDYNESTDNLRKSGELTAEVEAISEEQFAAQSAWYAEQIQNAPDAYDPEPVSDFASVPVNDLGARYAMTNGSTAIVSIGREGEDARYFDVSRADLNGYTVTESSCQKQAGWDPGLFAAWKEPSMRREDAEQVLTQELARLGLSDFSIVDAQKANLMHPYGDADRDGAQRSYTSLSQGWDFRLRRLYGGYPSVSSPIEPSASLNYESEPDYAKVTNIPDEEIRILIDESGIRSFRYSHPKEIIGIENENVDLLPFSEVQTRVKNTLCATLSGSWLEKEAVTEIEVYRLLLTCYTVHVRNSDDYFEIPCWVVLFDDPLTKSFRDDPDSTPQALLINAVDGSIIQAGY